MAGNDYHFVTHWRVEAPIVEVASILDDAPSLVRWWPSVYLAVDEVEPPDDDGVGRVVDLSTKGWLPYTLRWRFRTVESRYPYGFTIEAEGDFVGRGVWMMTQVGAWTDVTYDWRIRAEKPLLRYGSVILKPIFRANHRWAMARGEESLALEIARRRATTAEARAQVPNPPGPTSAKPAVAATLSLLVVAFALRRRHRAKRGTIPFDPDRVAHFEAAGWRAYYDRRWFEVLRLMARLCREQFRIPFPRSWQAAIAVAQAARAWAPVDHDVQKVRDYLLRFYRLAAKHSGMVFDPDRVAGLELVYYDVHRRLSDQIDKSGLLDAMVALHSALFGLAPDLARPSALWRVAANNTVDRITSRRSTDEEADWRKLEEELRACYRSICDAFAARQGGGRTTQRWVLWPWDRR